METQVSNFSGQPYWVYLLSDSGLVCVKTWANRSESAVAKVIAAEGCPERAVVGVYDKRVTKTISGWRLKVNYGSGWEYETFETTSKGYKENKAAYAKNCPYPQQWSFGRDSNPEWEYLQEKVKELTA